MPGCLILIMMSMPCYCTTVKVTHESSASVPNNFEGYTMKTGYKYKNKYLIDVNLAYNGTDRFGRITDLDFSRLLG